MKFTKRFLAVLISAMIVSTTFAAVPAFADFKDVTEAHNAYTAVNVLSKLGVINGYEGEDGSFSFKPDNNVTRAEFTAMLLRTRGMGAIGSTSLENPPFPDVVTPDVSWAIGNIRTAREMGIINGYDDGTFKPNNNVSYEEAVKMIVCALGYGNMGQDGALWYSRYLASAKTLGFIDGAGGAIGTSATRATIAKMLYNCLEVNLAENDEITSKTILENDLKLTKNIGYIDSNSEISLSSPDSNLRDDEVQIAALNEKGVMETNTYKVENASQYADMLGAEITFYYTLDRNSGFRHLIMASVRNSETLEIPVENVIDSDDSSIKYRKSLNDDSTATVSIAQGSVVVYNGKLFGADKESSTFSVYASEKGASKIPTIGNIKLIDRNGDKKFDVVFIESYEAWFVSSKTTSNYTIVDKVLLHNGNENAKKVLDPDYVNFKDLQGAKSSFSSINANSVVCIMESNSGNGAEVITTVVVCKDVVSGKITATSSKNGYTIGGKNYKISPQARWKNDIAPVHGDTGKFYLDCNGNIVTFIKSETESNQQYGYVTDTYEKMDEFESSLQLWIVTSANIKGKAYTVSDNAKLIDPEGNICQGTEIKDQLDDPDNKKLVKFKTNSKGMVDEIIMAADGGTEEIVSDKLYYYNFAGDDEEKTVPFTYNSTSKQLTSNRANVYVSSSAWIIRVPGPGNSEFKNMKSTDFTSKNGYKVEFYDVTTTKTAKVVLVHELPSGTTIGEVKANSPVVLIESIIAETETTGATRYRLNDNYSLSIEDDDTVEIAPDLNVGDIIRVGTDDEGYYTVKEKHIIFRAEDGYRETAKANGTSESDDYPYPKVEKSGSTVQFKIYWGEADSVDDEKFIVKMEEGNEDALSISCFKDAKIYEINTSKDSSSDDYIKNRTGDGYQNILSEIVAEKAEVFIHMTGINKVQTLIIVNRNESE